MDTQEDRHNSMEKDEQIVSPSLDMDKQLMNNEAAVVNSLDGKSRSFKRFSRDSYTTCRWQDRG